MTIKNKRLPLILCATVLILALVVLNLPVYEFSIKVYTKKSANTFPGDEKYEAVLAEVEAEKVTLEARGLALTLSEEQTLRETSKGQSSLMTFTLQQSIRRTAFQAIGSRLPPSVPLSALLVLIVLSVMLTALGYASGNRIIRNAACATSLLALLLVPISAMNATYNFYRAVKLYASGNDIAGVAALLPHWEKFLFGSADAETLKAALSGLNFNLLPLWWLMLPVCLLLILNAVKAAKGSLKSTLSRGGLYAAVIAICIVILYPFFVMVITGFRTPSEASDMNFLHMLPSKWIWSNITDIIGRDVFRFMGNSILLSTGATALSMLCGIPAAYAMSRMEFQGKKAFLGFIIMSQMFSPVVLLVGISKLMNTLGMSNSITGLIFVNAAFNQAFAIWLLRGVFVSISSEMEQAACIDGCTTVGALVRILLPMAAPGIVTALIFVFINSWNEYTLSTVLITNRLNKPITVGITEFSSYNMIEWQYLFAAAFLATIPVVILFMLIEKHLVSGLTSGGVKG